MTNSSVCGSGKGAGKGRRRLLGPAVAVILSAVIWGGCGNDVVDGGGYNPLVLRSNEAWALGYGYYSDQGVVFKADGRVFDIERRSGDTTWTSKVEGTYTLVDGNKLTVKYSGNDPRNGTWTIELSNGGNTLTEYPGDKVVDQNTITFIRTAGVNFTPANPGTGGRLVLRSGEAWVDWSDEDYGFGMVFGSDGNFKMLRNTDGTWVVYRMGTYSTSTPGGNITLNYIGAAEPYSGIYSVLGDTAIITIDGKSITFTKTTGVVHQLPPAGTGGNLVLPANQAWKSNDEYSNGIVFASDGSLRFIQELGNGKWVEYMRGSYSVSDGSYIFLSVDEGGGYFGAYSVSGNTLTIKDSRSKTMTFTKISGITITNSTGGNLVLPAGQAWVSPYTYGRPDDGSSKQGFMFLSNGTVYDLCYGCNYQDVWLISAQGTYTTSGAILNITWNYGSPDSMTYSVSDSRLLMGGTTYTVATGVDLDPPAPPISSGGNLVLPAGQAWVDWSDEDYGFGMVFGSDGYFKMLRNTDGTWVVSRMGTYSTRSGNITLDGIGSGIYSVSGNTAIITINGQSINLTKTTGVVPQLPPAGTGGNLVLPAGQAWVEYYDVDYAYGFIFASDGSFKIIRNINGTWDVYEEGTYLVNGGYLSLYFERDSEFTAYSVSGNTLTFTYIGGGQTVYTKTSGITITPLTPITAADLVLPSGQAWQDGTGSNREGYMFLSDGTIYDLDYGSGQWQIEQTGTYTVGGSGTSVSIRWGGESGYGTHSVSRSGNTLTFDGGTYTIATGVILSTGPTPPTTYTLTVNRNPSNGGTTTPASSQSGIAAGSSVNITASAGSGYTFNNWVLTSGSGTIANTGNASTSVTVNGNVTVTANFTQNTPPATYTLTVNRSPSNGGTTTPASSQSGIAAGSSVNITASAGSGYTFNNWILTSGSGTIANTGNASTSVTVNGNVTVTANFTPTSGGGGNNNCTSGATCKQVTIGTQKWMAENLNIQTADSWCYDNEPSNCAIYGRLYTWNAAKTACPSGWHLPSRAEWDVLAQTVGGPESAGARLKATAGWNNDGNGTDDYGFSALPGGRRIGTSNARIGTYGYWWTSTEDATDDYDDGFYRSMGYNDDGINKDREDKASMYSVRCLKD